LVPNDYDSDSAPETMRYASLAHRNAKRLLELKNQMIDLSKLDEGKMTLLLKQHDVLE